MTDSPESDASFMYNLYLIDDLPLILVDKGWVKNCSFKLFAADQTKPVTTLLLQLRRRVAEARAEKTRVFVVILQ